MQYDWTEKNIFREKRSIKDIYSNNSSILPCYLLSEGRVDNNLKRIAASLIAKGGSLSLGTISKVLKSLADELLISRSGEEIKVIQPAILLSKLLQSYKKPAIIEKIYIKLPDDQEEARNTLNKSFGPTNWMFTGESSAFKYATKTRDYQYEIYVSLDEINHSELNKYIDKRFYNYTVLCLKDKSVFFDSKENYASIIQTFLELSLLDKREKEIAEDIKRSIINGNK